MHVGCGRCGRCGIETAIEIFQTGEDSYTRTGESAARVTFGAWILIATTALS